MSALTKEEFNKIRENAEGYKADMTAFLRNIVKYPGESCDEKMHVKVIEDEMKKLGFDEVKTDDMGNVMGFMGSGEKLIAFDAHIDTVGIGNRDNWDFDPYEGFESDTNELKNDADMHSCWVSGASSVEELKRIIRLAGFEDIIVKEKPVSKEYEERWGGTKAVGEYIMSSSITARKP